MNELIDRNRECLTELCRRHRVQRLEVFGSAGTDRFDSNRSDLDFLVHFEDMVPSEHSRSYFGLWFALEDLFERKVDLVEGPAVTNPFLLRSIERSRRVLYAA